MYVYLAETYGGYVPSYSGWTIVNVDHSQINKRYKIIIMIIQFLVIFTIYVYIPKKVVSENWETTFLLFHKQ